MVRSLRAGLDQYQDPNVQRQIEQIMAQKAPSNPVKAVQYVFDRWRAGQMRRKGQRELGELSKALTEGDENRTTIIPATAGVTEGEAVVDVPGDTGAREGEYAINPTIAGINPESGALYGRKVALGKLLQDNPNNYAAQQALLANNQLLASQDAGLQLQKLSNENAVEAGILKHRRAKDLLKFKKELGVNASGRPSAPIQNIAEYMRLVKLEQAGKVPKGTAQRFTNYARPSVVLNTGLTQEIVNPATPKQSDASYRIRPKESDAPAFKGKQTKEIEREKAKVQRRTNLQKLYPKARGALLTLERKAETVTKAVDKATGLISGWSAGYGALINFLPESDAGALKGYLKTIKANIGFDRLGEMRANSPSGGALGNVSEMENRLLQAVNGALDQTQTAQLRENLQIIRDLYPRLLRERRQAFEYDFRDLIPTGASGDGEWEPIQ